MRKIVKRPLTTPTGHDVFTGEFVGSQLSFNMKDKQDEMLENFNKKEKNEKGEVFVEGLGWVK